MRGVELIDLNEILGSVSFRVKDDVYSTYYKVHINKYKDEKTISVRCGCPYNLGEICRHEAAALFKLQEMSDQNLTDGSDHSFNQRHTIVRMKQLDLKMIRALSSSVDFENAGEFLRTQTATIVEAKDEKVVAELTFDGYDFRVIIQKNEERNFDTSCSCGQTGSHPLCVHKCIVFLQLLKKSGADYFDSIRNLNKEKSKLLSLYGYTLDDDLKGKFEFTYKDGKPFLRVLDPAIKRVNTPAPVAIKSNSFVAEHAISQPPPLPSPSQKEMVEKRLGVVLSYTAHQYPFIKVDPVIGEIDTETGCFIGKIEKLDLAKYIDLSELNETDLELVQLLRKVLPQEVNHYLNRNSPFSGIWENIIQQHDEQLPEETRMLICEYLHPKYRKLFSLLSGNERVYYLPPQKSFQTASLIEAACAEKKIVPEFSVNRSGDHYEMVLEIKTASAIINISDNEMAAAFLFKYHDVFYLWEKPEDVLMAEKFLPEGKMTVPAENWPQLLKEFVLPLSKIYNVQFGNVEKEVLRNLQPEVKIRLKERGDYLLFQPVFTYNGYEVQKNDREKVVVAEHNKLQIIYRNVEAEKKWFDKFAALHSNFLRPEEGHSLILKGTEVLKNNWFFLFSDAVREMNVPVFGFDALKNFRFNTSRPDTKIFISSNTDWFDAKINVHFGDQTVSIDEIKKAISKKQQFVSLSDGSLGILPEEWLKKYALLFKVGEGRSSEMRLSKYHFSVIEDLYQQRDEEELMVQLEEKYDKLRYKQEIEAVEPPTHLASVLRPYQKAGFQWLNYMYEIGWGGILADDMGLGKTLQALSFLYYLKEKQGSLKALVVCPTTLLFNWENEIKKFTPSLRHATHHGPARSKALIKNTDDDIIITTYGTLRSDIKEFIDVKFDYVILDESQAIKNPSSKVAKAATLLNAKNKLCLSGTPLQNNTFDIYSQMNFLNPGMLGSVEFFRQEFAIPIDKLGEKEQKEHLRKILYPFILRRTKEQVAKDLPEKQEMILYCEMEKEQRLIYDAYRMDYREKILGTVEAQGIQRSQFTILQGLMKLRQICDSPFILKDENYPKVSVKLEEIAREIDENISDHKALIFSQFLGMLALIRERLEELGIDYEYFDGSTSVSERERAIKRFQTDEKCRIFLISLKAGGVGLNLTAADYVYIMDPWWNPAVEQQAIDRTHRIGQDKNIFAYRMICRDTVEDKIVALQEKKKMLAADLITDDSGFVKSLTKEDIEYLFS